MHRLLIPENEVFIRNMRPDEIAHYAELELRDDLIVSQLATELGNTAQLEMDLEQANDDAREFETKLDETREELADANSEITDIKEAIGAYLELEPAPCPEIEKLRDLAA